LPSIVGPGIWFVTITGIYLSHDISKFLLTLSINTTSNATE
jgi:hypothetical protein